MDMFLQKIKHRIKNLNAFISVEIMQKDQLISLADSSFCHIQIAPTIWWTHAQCFGYSLISRPAYNNNLNAS